MNNLDLRFLAIGAGFSRAQKTRMALRSSLTAKVKTEPRIGTDCLAAHQRNSMSVPYLQPKEGIAACINVLRDLVERGEWKHNADQHLANDMLTVIERYVDKLVKEHP